MRKALFITVGLCTALFCAFVSYRGIKVKLHPRQDYAPQGKDEIERYNTYIKYSIDRWASSSVSVSNGNWSPLLVKPENILHEEGGTFVKKGAVPLTAAQITSLTNHILDFFKVYSDGSYEAYLRFRSCVPYQLNLSSFDNDDGFKQWAGRHSTNYASVPPVQKLKAIWDYTAADNAFLSWVTDRIKADVAHGVRVSPDIESPYMKSLRQEFEGKVDSGALKPFLEHQILAFSTNDYFVYYVKTTNSAFRLYPYSNFLIRGGQMEGNDLFQYTNTPKSIIASQGYCGFAVITGAALVNSCNCYVPIVFSFYWSPADNDWLPYHLSRYVRGNYYALY